MFHFCVLSSSLRFHFFRKKNGFNFSGEKQSNGRTRPAELFSASHYCTWSLKAPAEAFSSLNGTDNFLAYAEWVFSLTGHLWLHALTFYDTTKPWELALTAQAIDI